MPAQEQRRVVPDHREGPDRGRGDVCPSPAGGVDSLIYQIYRDPQQDPPTGYCSRCGGELYGEEPERWGGFCEECRLEEENDALRD